MIFSLLLFLPHKYTLTGRFSGTISLRPGGSLTEHFYFTGLICPQK